MISYGAVLLVAGAYLAGSVPFAYIIVKLVKGEDIRTLGSGNPGATNAARILGKWGFAAVFILDFLKGFLPVFISVSIFSMSAVTLVTAAAAVLGHTYTVFLSFKGGKGVATAAGVFFALTPLAAVIAITVFLAVFAATRMVSAGSITAATALFIAVFFTSDYIPLKIFTGLAAVFVIYKHRANISRIVRGEENRFGGKKKNVS